MKLYFSPGACSLSPHIVSREAGIELSLERVDLATKQTASGLDFSKINPKGYVPVLELADGQLLTEVPAILQFVADQNPESGLAPKPGTMARYRLQEWLGFIGTELHKTFGPLFNRKAPEDWKSASKDLLGRRFDYLAAHLDGKTYLLGESFTAADAYLFTVVGWTKYVGMDLGKWPLLGHYVERIASRPAVQAAMKAEGLLK